MGIETAILAAAVASAVGTVAGGIGQLNSGIAANKAAKAAANQELQAGQTNAAIKRRQGQVFMGKQRAAFGAMGMDVMGNALDAIEMSAQENELEAQSILTNSRFSAYNYTVQGRMAAAQGRAGFVTSLGQAAGTMMMGMNGSKGSAPQQTSNLRMPSGMSNGTFKPTYNPSGYTSGYGQ